MLQTLSDLLIGIARAAPEAVIAGGAIRDTLLKRPVKDIDVFVHINSIDVVGDVLEGRGLANSMRITDAYKKWESGVVEVREYGQDTPVNVIATDKLLTPQEHLSSFDFGLCRVALTGSGLLMSEDFARDRDKEQFTLLRCGSTDQYLRSLARYERLRCKYEGWPMVVPYQFAECCPEL